MLVYTIQSFADTIHFSFKNGTRHHGPRGLLVRREHPGHQIEDMVELVEWMQRECPVSWRLLAVRDVDDKVGNGFTIVIRKTDPDRPTSLTQRAIGALRVR